MMRFVSVKGARAVASWGERVEYREWVRTGEQVSWYAQEGQQWEEERAVVALVNPTLEVQVIEKGEAVASVVEVARGNTATMEALWRSRRALPL